MISGWSKTFFSSCDVDKVKNSNVSMWDKSFLHQVQVSFKMKKGIRGIVALTIQ